jgi:hypothetical protein
MVRTEFETPEPLHTKCLICDQPLVSYYHWIPVLNYWMRSSCHAQCVETWKRDNRGKDTQPFERPVPERFAHFDPRQANAEALKAVQGFWHASALKTLVIAGVPARGKSRLMWATIASYFDELEQETGAKRWVDYYLFTDLITEWDRTLLSKVKMGKYVFIDDVGSTDCYGRERAQLQDVIRTRVQKGQWTFLTIDSMDFDPGLPDFFKERAVTVYLDQ